MSSSLLGDLSSQIQAVTQSADANKTLTIDDGSHQVFTGLTVTRDVTLPTTGIRAGHLMRIENTTAFDLVVKSSNGSALTVANSANINATVANGFVLLRATQAAPTTPAHWRVLAVEDTLVLDSASGAWNTGSSVRFSRIGRVVTITTYGGVGDAGVSFTSSATLQQTASGYVPLRFRPTSTSQGGNNVGQGGVVFAVQHATSAFGFGNATIMVTNPGQISWGINSARGNMGHDMSVTYTIV